MSLLRKKVRGVALVDLLSQETGQTQTQTLIVALDRAVLRQVAGIDDEPGVPSQKRAL